MPAECMDKWFNSRRPAFLAGRQFWLQKHPVLRDSPLSVLRGQAEVYCLLDSDGNSWLLKKCHPGKGLDRHYLEAVSRLLPQHPGLKTGTDRTVLTKGSLKHTPGSFFSVALNHWLDNTILMTRAQGVDWTAVADQLRSGSLVLQASQRLTVCQRLNELVQVMEHHRLAHRDIACGNAFFELSSPSCAFIDFDSAFHPSLSMPKATTCGTSGYAAPFAWRGDYLDACATWCEHADRYACAILSAEILVLGPQSPMTGEGGIFDQDDLRRRSGKTVDHAADALAQHYSQALSLFRAAIKSRGFDDCPSPGDWIACCQTLMAGLPRPPKLSDLEPPDPEFFRNCLHGRRTLPFWRPPRLADLNDPWPFRPGVPLPTIPLPSGPWKRH
ncbi:MAG: serine/threonine-protein kinase [Planctomycetota bacterium]|nr:serine/threonine-protein kinase [Planctomycetota bacterium]